jgi:hypothetical protein
MATDAQPIKKKHRDINCDSTVSPPVNAAAPEAKIPQADVTKVSLEAIEQMIDVVASQPLDSLVRFPITDVVVSQSIDAFMKPPMTPVIVPMIIIIDIISPNTDRIVLGCT